MLRWRNGLFLPEPGVSSLDMLARKSRADEIFIDLLKRLSAEGRNISHHANLNTYGPTVFVKEAEAKKIRLSKAELEAGMRRLFADGKIRAERYGPPSKSYSHLVINEGT